MKIPIDRIVLDVRNPNAMSKDDRKKIARLIERANGVYPPVIVRPIPLEEWSPTHPLKTKQFAMVDGEQRYYVVRDELHHKEIEANVFAISEEAAGLMLLTLNRLRGTEDQGKRDEIIRAICGENFPATILADHIPENARQIMEVFDGKSIMPSDEAILAAAREVNEDENKPATMRFRFSPNQFTIVNTALDKIRAQEEDPKMSNARALELLAAEFVS